MNAPDISIHSKVTAKVRDDALTPANNEQGLDDVATLFPGMEVFHDLRISGHGDTQLLCSVSSLLNSRGTKIIGLSLRSGKDDQICIKCRLSDLTSKGANEIVEQLLRESNITSARVEHVILRAG